MGNNVNVSDLVLLFLVRLSHSLLLALLSSASSDSHSMKFSTTSMR